MINQHTSITKDYTRIKESPNQLDIHLLKRHKRENFVSSPSSDDDLSLHLDIQNKTTNENFIKGTKYFHSEISNNTYQRRLYLEKIFKEYELKHLRLHLHNLLPPTPPGLSPNYNSNASLSTTLPSSADDTFNTSSTYKKYLLNDNSSYSINNTDFNILSITSSSSSSSIPSPIAYSKQTNFLKPSMVFTGYQISGYKRYQVTVTLKTVDFPSPYNTNTYISTPHMTGFLSIKGLTNYHNEISTFFESFAVTNNNFGFFSSSWNNHFDLTSFDSNDLEHWLGFPSFKEMFNIDQFNNYNNNKSVDIGAAVSNYVKDYLNQRYIFMRWKEKFLVDNPDMQAIEGASFEGYYYIVHDQFTGSIQGFYYHKDAERFQQLELFPYAKVPGSSSHEFA